MTLPARHLSYFIFTNEISFEPSLVSYTRGVQYYRCSGIDSKDSVRLSISYSMIRQSCTDLLVVWKIEITEDNSMRDKPEDKREAGGPQQMWNNLRKEASLKESGRSK